MDAWATTTDFPDSMLASTCFSNGAYVYCISPGNNNSYFAKIGVPSSDSIQVENPPPYSVASYLGPSWTESGSCGESCNGGPLSGGPCMCWTLDCAYVFDCASEAATSKGCTTTVVSTGNTAYNYQMTIWYPCKDTPSSDTNCCYQPNNGCWNSPEYGWCISTGSNSFIISGGGGVPTGP
jgi:hypothetical protein